MDDFAPTDAPWAFRLTHGGSTDSKYVCAVRLHHSVSGKIFSAESGSKRVGMLDHATSNDLALILCSPDLLAACLSVVRYFSAIDFCLSNGTSVTITSLESPGGESLPTGEGEADSLEELGAMARVRVGAAIDRLQAALVEVKKKREWKKN